MNTGFPFARHAVWHAWRDRPTYATRRLPDDGQVIAAIKRYVLENPQHGFDELYPGVGSQGFSKCRRFRVYRALRLNIKRRGKRRPPECMKARLVIPTHPNEVRSADFMYNALWLERRFRTFNVIGDLNREVQRMEVDTSLPAQRVVRTHDELVEVRGKTDRPAYGELAGVDQR